MKKRELCLFLGGILTCVLVVIGFRSLNSEAKASPVSAIPDRDMYYPGTEELGPDEMRVIACGTGMTQIKNLV